MAKKQIGTRLALKSAHEAKLKIAKKIIKSTKHLGKKKAGPKFKKSKAALKMLAEAKASKKVIKQAKAELKKMHAAVKKSSKLVAQKKLK